MAEVITLKERLEGLTGEMSRLTQQHALDATELERARGACGEAEREAGRLRRKVQEWQGMGKAASESLAVADKVSREKRKDERDRSTTAPVVYVWPY